MFDQYIKSEESLRVAWSQALGRFLLHLRRRATVIRTRTSSSSASSRWTIVAWTIWLPMRPALRDFDATLHAYATVIATVRRTANCSARWLEVTGSQN
jgi:hypothetical protein